MPSKQIFWSIIKINNNRFTIAVNNYFILASRAHINGNDRVRRRARVTIQVCGEQCMSNSLWHV